jgi:hypothetical protein
MLQEAINVNQFLVGYGQKLLSEIPDERMTEQPLPGVNHPARIFLSDRLAAITCPTKRLLQPRVATP